MFEQLEDEVSSAEARPHKTLRNMRSRVNPREQ
jgi:hypothetical protein